MKVNSNLHQAKRAKNDEFYTNRQDVEAELYYYREHFSGKSVYCNCDSAKSAFYQYFKMQYSHLGLSGLVATHYDTTGGAYKITFDGTTETKTFLECNGDFRSPECMQLLSECDIVVTNPPFSLFREFVAALDQSGKKFLVVGSMNAITYKEIFPLIKQNKLWLGINSVKRFLQPDGSEKVFGNICWFTNMEHRKRNEIIPLACHYTPEEYPTYDNYDAINVDSVNRIPVDYFGCIGVPITFLTKYNPEQFEIVDANFFITNSSTPHKPHGLIKDKDGSINGIPKYARILIKHKNGL